MAAYFLGLQFFDRCLLSGNSCDCSMCNVLSTARVKYLIYAYADQSSVKHAVLKVIIIN